MFLAFFIVGASVVSYASPGDGKGKPMTTIEKIAGLNTASIAFTPMAITAKMKANKTWDALDDGQKKFMEDLELEVNGVMEKAVKGFMTSEEVTTEINKLGKGLSPEQLKSFNDMLEATQKHALFIEKHKDLGIAKESEEHPIIKALKENKDKIDLFKSSKTGSVSIEVKSAQAPSDIATHTIGERVPGIGQLPLRKPFMRDLFNTINCTLEYIKYIDQETAVRDAKNVATAGVTTHTTKLTWKERSIQITNVRDFIDIPINMLDDYEFVEGEIRRLIDSSVQLKIDNGLLKDDGTYPNLHSVDEVASEFDATNTLGGTIEAWALKVQAPNLFDLVIAMSSQIVALGKDGSFMPNVVLVNTIDRYKSLLIKDKNDNYILPPFVARSGNQEFTIEGMVVKSNPNVAANSMYVMDSTKGTIYQRKNATIEMSFENNSNFETEVVTLKGYERLNLLIRNVDKNAFMKCSDVATAITAITKPA